MRIIKKISHWILFIIGSYIGLNIVLTIATLLPIYVGAWLFSFSNFWFFVIGAILSTFYYFFAFGLPALFFNFLNGKKPDYWISNILLVLISIYFYYNLINNISSFVDINLKLFINFKGFIFLTTLVPAFLQILFFTVVAPFLMEEND